MNKKLIKTVFIIIFIIINISLLFNQKMKITELFSIDLSIYKGKTIEEFLSNIDTNYYAFYFRDNKRILKGCDLFFPVNDTSDLWLIIFVKDFQFLDPRINKYYFWDIDLLKKEKIDSIVIEYPIKIHREDQLNYMKLYYENKDRIIKELKEDSLNQKKK